MEDKVEDRWRDYFGQHLNGGEVTGIEDDECSGSEE